MSPSPTLCTALSPSAVDRRTQCSMPWGRCSERGGWGRSRPRYPSSPRQCSVVPGVTIVHPRVRFEWLNGGPDRDKERMDVVLALIGRRRRVMPCHWALDRRWARLSGSERVKRGRPLFPTYGFALGGSRWRNRREATTMPVQTASLLELHRNKRQATDVSGEGGIRIGAIKRMRVRAAETINRAAQSPCS